MRRAILQLIYRFFLYPGQRLYLAIIRPATFGVRVVVIDPGSRDILVVRHSYGRRDLWFVPGGGYAPRTESPSDAAQREVREETGVAITDLRHLGSRQGKGRGNLDTVEFFAASALSRQISPSVEIQQAAWVSMTDLAELPLSSVTVRALTLMQETDPANAD